MKIFSNKGTITIDAREMHPAFVLYALSSTTRYITLVLGVLIAFFGHAHLGMPGGSNFNRPIDFHIKIFKEIGCLVTETKGRFHSEFVITLTKHKTIEITCTEFKDLLGS